MHDIKNLEGLLGYTYGQIRIRLEQFAPFLNRHIVRGSKNKILIDNNGLEILKRIKDLEMQSKDLKEIQNILQTELKLDERNQGNYHQIIAEKDAMIEMLKSQLTEKQDEIRFLRERIVALENIIHNRLPPTPEEIREKLAQGISRWMRFKQLLKGV